MVWSRRQDEEGCLYREHALAGGEPTIENMSWRAGKLAASQVMGKLGKAQS